MGSARNWGPEEFDRVKQMVSPSPSTKGKHSRKEAGGPCLKGVALEGGLKNTGMEPRVAFRSELFSCQPNPRNTGWEEDIPWGPELTTLRGTIP